MQGLLPPLPAKASLKTRAADEPPVLLVPQPPATPMPTSTSPLPSHAGLDHRQHHKHQQQRHGQPRKPRVFVAKQVPEDLFGREDDVYVAPGAKTIPMTLVLPNPNAGPRRAEGGKYVEHTVLGDVEDFAEFERLYSKPEDTTAGDSDAQEDHARAVDHGHPGNDQHARQKHAHHHNHGHHSHHSHHRHQLHGHVPAGHGANGARTASDDRREWLNRLHIFQRYREVREEHALSNWKRHSVEWNRVEESVAKRSNKPVEELLMTRLGEYRQFVEERDLIEEALLLLEEHKVNFWKTGLRIGNDLLGLCFQMPRGGLRQIERLRMSEPGWKPTAKKLTEYQMARKAELRHVISHLDPFYVHGEGGYIEVVGHGVQDDGKDELAKAYMDRLGQRMTSNLREKSDALGQHSQMPTLQINAADSPGGSSIHSHAQLGDAQQAPAFQDELLHNQRQQQPDQTQDDKQDVGSKQQADQESKAMPGLSLTSGIHLMFSAKRLFFQVTLGEVSSSILTVHNRGTVAVRFEWVPVQRPNPLKVRAVHDGIQRFYLSHTSGVILPGTAYDFPIIFKSASPGLFTELWSLVTSPVMPHQPDLFLTLQGLAIEEDVYMHKRHYIEKMLDKRHAEAVVRQTIELILRNIKTSPKRSDTGVDPNKGLFERHNKDLHLPFQTAVFEKMEELADSTYALLGIKTACWDRSLSSLYESITRIPQPDVRSASIAKLNQLVHQASESQSIPRTSVLYAICYDIFIDVSGKVADTSESMRKRLGLPLTRAAAKFFDAEESPDDSFEAAADAAKPPVAVPEPGKKPGAPGAANNATNPNDPKKPAPAPAAPAAAKDAKKGGAAAPPAKPAEPAKKGGVAGKKPNEAPPAEVEEAVHPVTAPKAATKKRLDSAKSWNLERRAGEATYAAEFRSAVRDVVDKAILRLCGLFEDIDGSMPPHGV
ncbi:MYCBP-associated protein family-domain-containing protein [Entophlyctis helioformis]|nr:MYCBP-associated protein family-domain-containing protein [Entophlyctis helioformis]